MRRGGRVPRERFARRSVSPRTPRLRRDGIGEQPPGTPRRARARRPAVRPRRALTPAPSRRASRHRRTTTGRPWPIAVASTPDASVRRYGRTTSVASAHEPRNLVFGQEPEPPIDAPVHTKLARELPPPARRNRADRRQRRGEPSGSSASARTSTSRPLYARINPKEEQRRAHRRLGLRRRVELEDGMRDVRDALLVLCPSAARSSTRCRECTSDPAHDVVDLAPRVDAGTVVARQRVMRGVHRRQACSNASQPTNVEARPRQPLHVHDVRLEAPRRRRKKPPHARQIPCALEGRTARRERGLRASILPLTGRKSSSRR